ncbi:unnamed protein product, partial [marine sediment metagenome]
SLGGSSAAKKAAKHSAFARGAQNLSEGGFGELAGIKEMIGSLVGKVGTGGGKGDWMQSLAPIFIEKLMKQSSDNGGAPASLPGSQQSPSVNIHTGGKI